MLRKECCTSIEYRKRNLGGQEIGWKEWQGIARASLLCDAKVWRKPRLLVSIETGLYGFIPKVSVEWLNVRSVLFGHTFGRMPGSEEKTPQVVIVFTTPIMD